MIDNRLRERVKNRRRRRRYCHKYTRFTGVLEYAPKADGFWVRLFRWLFRW